MILEQPIGSYHATVAESKRAWRRAAFGILLLVTGALCAATRRPADAGEPPHQAFRFVQICDTQLGFGAMGYDADLRSFRQAVRQVNAIVVTWSTFQTRRRLPISKPYSRIATWPVIALLGIMISGTPSSLRCWQPTVRQSARITTVSRTRVAHSWW